jgi:hypothetical protein
MEIGAAALEPLSDDLAAGLGGAQSLPSASPARGGAGMAAAASAAPAGG